MTQPALAALDAVVRQERGRALATLVRILGDLDRAEDALQDAVIRALEVWPRTGVPSNPRAWLVAAARNRAIDRLRRQATFARKQPEISLLADLEAQDWEPDVDRHLIADDQLRLVFTCCHPALAIEASVALTLRTLGGLETAEIARAFLVPVPTMAQRLVRVKHKIAKAGIPYAVPEAQQLGERIDGVLAVVYLIFTEGYAATSGQALVRRELCTEAIRLGRLMVDLLPDQPSPKALLALMLLQDSRRATRTDSEGRLVLLADQDRSAWDHDAIAQAGLLVEAALRAGPPSAYAIQAAIAACHANATTAAHTDWAQIVGLYDVLFRLQPTPVVALNRAVAVAMTGQLEQGLALLDQLEAAPELAAYHLLPAARADFLRRLGRPGAAAEAYRAALQLVGNDAERAYLAGRLAEVSELGPES